MTSPKENAKKYMTLKSKMAAAVFRARTDILDPTPRKPYWETILKCKFCHAENQGIKHYVVEKEIFVRTIYKSISN